MLDGGKYNGVSEHNFAGVQTAGAGQGAKMVVKTNIATEGKSLRHNCTILMHNVRNFKIENLYISNQRYWGMCFMYCRFGEIRNIEFKANLSMLDDNGVHHPDKIPTEYKNLYIENGDGIDLRTGCNNILIENISGFTQDDSIAMTSLHGIETTTYAVKGKDFDIHHITIKNLRTYVWRWADNIRILCHDGHKIHDIFIDGVMDVSSTDCGFRNGAAVLISDRPARYVKEKWVAMGDMYNISINNVFSRAAAAIRFYGPLECVNMKNIHTMEDVTAAIACEKDAELKNVQIDGVYCPSVSKIGAIFDFCNINGKLVIKNVYCDEAEYVIRNTGDAEIISENINVGKIKKSYFDTSYTQGHMNY